jgi:hypothetical protein
MEDFPGNLHRRKPLKPEFPLRRAKALAGGGFEADRE